MSYVTAFGQLKIKHEELFLRFAKGWDIGNTPPSEVGRKQFFDHETSGIIPEHPDPYYDCLRVGKQWLHWQIDELRKSYGTIDWHGWYALWMDYRGERHLLRMFTRWMPEDKKPSWLYKEDGQLSEKEREQLL